MGDDKPIGFCWDFAAARHCTRSLLDTMNSGRGSKRSGTACSREWETKWTSPFLSLKSMSVCPVTCHYLFDATKDQTDQTPLMGKRACTAWGSAPEICTSCALPSTTRLQSGGKSDYAQRPSTVPQRRGDRRGKPVRRRRWTGGRGRQAVTRKRPEQLANKYQVSQVAEGPMTKTERRKAVRSSFM